MKIASEAGMFF